ncbi:MAG: hypothetical protein ACMV0I_03705 [Pseudomonas sp.]
MTVYRVKGLNPHAGQKKVLEEAGRFNLVAGGRRSGKTMLALKIVTETVFDGKGCALVFPNKGMMEYAFKSLSKSLRQVTGGMKNIGALKEIRLVTGGTIKFYLAEKFEPMALRGRIFHAVLIEEAAMLGVRLKKIHKLASEVTEIFDGKVYLLSTPRYGSHFNKMFLKQRTKWKKFHLSVWDNPFFNKAQIDELKATMSEFAFKQEIEGVAF